MVTGLIFDIKRYAIHDGPGIRTTVFFKGCPLSCMWCHNPEGHSFKPKLMIWPDRCIKCRTYVQVCPNSAILYVNNLIITDHNKCKVCGACTEVCPTIAREIVGKYMTVEELLNEVKRDLPFYEESGGGVTVSGGEPLAQPEFLHAFLIICKENSIHTALDTSGYAETEIIKKISKYVDLFLYNIKIMDDERHKLYTGVSNKLVLYNLKVIDSLGKRIWIRFPLIPGVNGDEINIHAMGEFISKLKNVEELDILPYHELGIDKARRLGMEMRIFEKPSGEMIRNIKEELEDFGLKVRVGG